MSLLHLNDEPGRYPESWYAETTPQLPRLPALASGKPDLAALARLVGPAP